MDKGEEGRGGEGRRGEGRRGEEERGGEEREGGERWDERGCGWGREERILCGVSVYT